MRYVTDVGTGISVTATAFLYAQPDKLACYDRVEYPPVDRLRALAGRTTMVFCERDALREELEETDLLFLDALHDYGQL